MTFRAHTASGGTFDFEYGYDAADLVRAEAERIADGDAVNSVYRVLTPEEQQFRDANGVGGRRR